MKAAQRTQMAVAEKKRKREEAAAAELMLRKERLAEALRRTDVAHSLVDFEKRVRATGY